jgi:carbon-monoxide dehydrogenase large subunit
MNISWGMAPRLIAAAKIVERGRKLAAHLIEASVEDIEFTGGKFCVAGTDRSLPLEQIAMASLQPARLPPGMGFYENATYALTRETYPNSCHVCEVEVDPDTGVVELLRYLVVDDVGTVINPLTLKGQIHGGVSQGAGPDPDRAGGLRARVRPASVGELHELRPATRKAPEA